MKNQMFSVAKMQTRVAYAILTGMVNWQDNKQQHCMSGVYIWSSGQSGEGASEQK